MAHEGLHGDLMESSASQALDRLHPPAVDVTRQEAARADGRSVVMAASTAKGMSSPTTRIPWLRSKTARPEPRACATALAWAGEVTSPAVPSKTGTPLGNSSPSWESSASP